MIGFSDGVVTNECPASSGPTPAAGGTATGSLMRPSVFWISSVLLFSEPINVTREEGMLDGLI